MPREPIVPVSAEQRETLLQFKGFVILGQEPQSNTLSGYVEHSFCMGWDSGYALLFLWHPIRGWRKTEESALRDAEEWLVSARKKVSDAKIWDIHDPELPVVFDMESWIDAQAYNPNTLSGVSNKFKARNAAFTMKD